MPLWSITAPLMSGFCAQDHTQFDSIASVESIMMASSAYADLRHDTNIWLKENRQLMQQTKQSMKGLSKKQIEYRSLLVDSLLFQSLSTFASRRPSKLEQKAFQNELINSIVIILENR
jgi:hypothetical protein